LGLKRPGVWDIVYSIDMAIACFISYLIITRVLSQFVVDASSVLLGGMWAVVATVFVFKDTRAHSLAAGAARIAATLLSFALCFLYLSFFPPSGAGMALLIGFGTFLMILLNRQEDITTAGITTAVVMVVAIMDPEHARQQPVLRLIDTLIGVATGVACKWTASLLFYKIMREEPQ
jgi:uncharacterized membrane protein YccC